MKRLTLALSCVALSLAACAQDATPSVAAKPGAQARKPVVAAGGVEPTFAAGSPEARARDTIRKLVATIPAKDRIVFAPANPKYTVTIFTDVECGYCRKFHHEIAEVNRQGIAVEYLAFPRMGLGSADHQKMVSVWCAADRKKALTDAKNDRPFPNKSCTNPVTMEYDVGQRAGLTGTPMVLAADGTTLGGYLSPQQLRTALDRLAAGKTVGKSNATEPATGRGGAGQR